MSMHENIAQARYGAAALAGAALPLVLAGAFPGVTIASAGQAGVIGVIAVTLAAISIRWATRPSTPRAPQERPAAPATTEEAFTRVGAEARKAAVTVAVDAKDLGAGIAKNLAKITREAKRTITAATRPAPPEPERAPLGLGTRATIQDEAEAEAYAAPYYQGAYSWARIALVKAEQELERLAFAPPAAYREAQERHARAKGTVRGRYRALQDAWAEAEGEQPPMTPQEPRFTPAEVYNADQAFPVHLRSTPISRGPAPEEEEDAETARLSRVADYHRRRRQAQGGDTL